MWRERSVTGFESGWRRAASGLYVPATVRRAQYDRPVAVDLFCGCGGFSLGFMQAGWRVVAAVDNDPWATLTYCMNLGTYPMQFHFATADDRERLEVVFESEMRRNGRRLTESLDADPALAEVLDEESQMYYVSMRSGSGWISHQGNEVLGVPHFFFGDIRQVTGQQILDAIGLEQGDVGAVIGGPPCQGFSTSGKRQVMDPRNSLVFDFARLVIEIGPKTMVMENVPGIASMVTPDGIPVIDALCRILEDGGFGTYERLRQGLLETAGVGAAFRSKPGRLTASSEGEDEAVEPAGEQMALF